MGQAIGCPWEVRSTVRPTGPRREECNGRGSLCSSDDIAQPILSTVVETQGRIKASASFSAPVWWAEPQLIGSLSDPFCSQGGGCSPELSSGTWELMGDLKIDTRWRVDSKGEVNQEVTVAYACHPSCMEDWGRRIENLSLAYRVYLGYRASSRSALTT